MKIQVLQGINFENPITTIKITCDTTPKTDLIDLIHNFHPVFLEKYTVEGSTISIQSKLPHLWKESAVALNNYSTNEWSYDLAKKYILEEVIKKQVKSMSTIPILRAAHELGYETIQFYIEEGLTGEGILSKYNRYYSIGIGQEAEINISIASSRDSNIAKMTQEDKWLTNIVLDRLKLPIAKWELVKSKDQIKELHEKYAKPYVIKPVGLTGGHGVTTNITTLEQAEKAYAMANDSINTAERKDWQKKIMIQEQVAGEDYRILVINGKMEIATKRIPAFITGDGQNTIKQLIELTNTDPRRDVTDPTHVLKPIVIDEQLETFLSEQGLSKDYTPANNQKIYVRKVASMSQGGITEDFTHEVHPQTKYIVESLASTLHAFALGVDVICTDISKPLTNGNGSIIECNTMPEAYLNAFPVIGNQYPQIGKIVVNGLVGDKPTTKKIVALGCSLDQMNQYLKLNTLSQADRMGIYSEGNMYINGELINRNMEAWRAIEALKINTSLSVIALHYPNLLEAQEIGLGFDNIDLVLVGKDMSEEYTKTLEGYLNVGLIKKIEVI